METLEKLAALEAQIAELRQEIVEALQTASSVLGRLQNYPDARKHHSSPGPLSSGRVASLEKQLEPRGLAQTRRRGCRYCR